MTAVPLRGILLDVNVGRTFNRMIKRHLVGSEWSDLWQELGLTVLTLSLLDLPDNTPDDVVWHACQREGFVLLTCNRNDSGNDSLEATIRRDSQTYSLPVFTISDVDRFGSDAAYDARLARSLVAYLVEIDKVRGTGRLYIPID